MRKIVRQFVVNKPVSEVIRQFQEEGWTASKVTADGATFKRTENPVLVRASKAQDN